MLASALPRVSDFDIGGARLGDLRHSAQRASSCCPLPRHRVWQRLERSAAPAWLPRSIMTAPAISRGPQSLGELRDLGSAAINAGRVGEIVLDAQVREQRRDLPEQADSPPPGRAAVKGDVPWSAATRPAIASRIVVLPPPGGPSSASRSPPPALRSARMVNSRRSTWISASSTAATGSSGVPGHLDRPVHRPGCPNRRVSGYGTRDRARRIQ
jgi:hypothetical protein